MPNFKGIRIEVDIDNLPQCTDEEFEEWVRFETGKTGWLSGDNPLRNNDLEAHSCYLD